MIKRKLYNPYYLIESHKENSMELLKRLGVKFGKADENDCTIEMEYDESIENLIQDMVNCDYIMMIQDE